MESEGRERGVKTTWVVWHRPEREYLAEHEPWVPILAGEDERDVITRSNAMRLEGEVMILSGGLDPNHPRPLESRKGRHHGSRVVREDPPVVVRGRNVERVLEGREQ